MAVSNLSLPFGSLSPPIQSWNVNLSPQQLLAANTNNLLYPPDDHQQQRSDEVLLHSNSASYTNNPYAPPQLRQEQQQHRKQVLQFGTNIRNTGNSQMRRKNDNGYLPPFSTQKSVNLYNLNQQEEFPIPQIQQQQQRQHFSQTNLNKEQYKVSTTATESLTHNKAAYTHLSNSGSKVPSELILRSIKNQQQNRYYNTYNNANTPIETYTSSENDKNLPATIYGPTTSNTNEDKVIAAAFSTNNNNNNDYLEHSPPPQFKRIQAGQGSRTQVHAVLDYDFEEGDQEENLDTAGHNKVINKNNQSDVPVVTPIQGPIFLKNGTVPVVPLFSYPSISNGTLVQIPIWWTALSVALGLDVSGDVIRGVPCVKRFHQLFCPTAGNNYPIDKIERFIDDNKALMRRMYGDFEMNMDNGGSQTQIKKRRRRFIDEPDLFISPGAYEAGESYFGKLRYKRQTSTTGNRKEKKANDGISSPGSTTSSSTGRLDACGSKIEIVTPYWASNSAGKIRAIVNTQHFEQAIHQEICSKSQTSRCEKGCGCEQKYKWHRLLAYDPDNDCKGIFMDWFLFPSCCICRCDP